jgi:8-oxo-dGTP diphosphatase
MENITRIEYVAGFLFSPDYQQVVLIKKEKPAWQAGKLNAVGGKVELGETPVIAMSREFEEEAGLKIDDWKSFCTLSGEGYVVHFFYSVSDDFKASKTCTHESVGTYVTSDIIASSQPKVPEILHNISWLMTLVLSIASGQERCKKFEIIESNADK